MTADLSAFRQVDCEKNSLSSKSNEKLALLPRLILVPQRLCHQSKLFNANN